MECMRQVGVVAELYGTVGSVLTGTASQFIGTQTIRYTALHQLCLLYTSDAADE